MEDKYLKELEAFKVRLLSLNKTKTPEIFNTVWNLIDPKGYLSQEAQLIFDIDNLKMEKSEKLKLIGEIHQLTIVDRHIITIARKSIGGKDFEKQVHFLIKKLVSLPERWHDGILIQISDCLKSVDNYKNENPQTALVLLNLKSTMNKTIDVRQLELRNT